MRSWRRRILLWLGLIAAGWLTLQLIAAPLADAILYQPPPVTGDPASADRLTSSLGDEIAWLHLPAPEGGPTVIFLHGNATDLQTAADFLHRYHQHGFGILAIDYPGYGASGGTPSEAGLYAAALSAVDHALKELHIPADRLLIHGNSLGCAPAIYAASQRPVAGLILDSPFLTLYRVRTVWPILFGDRFRNDLFLPQTDCPVLIRHGAEDRTIPAWHSAALARRIGDRAERILVPEAGHNDLRHRLGATFWDQLTAFARRSGAWEDHHALRP